MDLQDFLEFLAILAAGSVILALIGWILILSKRLLGRCFSIFTRKKREAEFYRQEWQVTKDKLEEWIEHYKDRYSFSHPTEQTLRQIELGAYLNYLIALDTDDPVGVRQRLDVIEDLQTG